MSSQSRSKQDRLSAFERLCRRKGLPLTVQRRSILEAVLEREDHPTAEQVFETVRDRLPGVSRTTIYRVLDTLVQVGVINRVCHPGKSVRFDARVEQHHHLVCVHCDKVLDVEDTAINALQMPEVDTLGFQITEFHIDFRGTCPDCLCKLAPADKDRKET